MKEVETKNHKDPHNCVFAKSMLPVFRITLILYSPPEGEVMRTYTKPLVAANEPSKIRGDSSERLKRGMTK